MLWGRGEDEREEEKRKQANLIQTGRRAGQGELPLSSLNSSSSLFRIAIKSCTSLFQLESRHQPQLWAFTGSNVRPLPPVLLTLLTLPPQTPSPRKQSARHVHHPAVASLFRLPLLAQLLPPPNTFPLISRDPSPALEPSWRRVVSVSEPWSISVRQLPTGGLQPLTLDSSGTHFVRLAPLGMRDAQGPCEHQDRL